MQPYKAWLVAPKGRGTDTDAQAIQALALDPQPIWVRVSPHKAKVVKALKELAAHDGPRLLWIVGNACFDDPDWCLRTDCISDGLRLGAIGELLATAADAHAAPLIAIVDVCHAGHVKPTRTLKHDNLALFLACDQDELARADDRGGWLTRALIDALTTLPGAIDLHTLDGFVLRRRNEEALGTQWPHALLGKLKAHVLHHSAGAPRPRSAPPAPAPAPDPIAAWKRHMRALHQDLFPIFGAAEAADEVFVELELGADFEPEHRDLRNHLAHSHRPLTLGALMAMKGPWAVLGEPGAGKSTLARHLTWELADELKDGPVPVYLPLAGFSRSGKDNLFDYAADLLSRFPGVERAQVAALPAALARAKQLVLLLDGLDEVAGPAMVEVRECLQTLPNQLPQAHIAVFARPIGFEKLPRYQAVRVRPLPPEGQRALLGKWLKNEALADGAWARVRGQETLRAIAGYPLMLTLIALLYRERKDLPPTRVQLFTAALDQLLKRGYSALAPAGVPHPEEARRVLRHLSLTLQRTGGEQWEPAELEATLRAIEEGQVLVDEVFEEQWDKERLPDPRDLQWWERLLIWLHLRKRPQPTLPDLRTLATPLHGDDLSEVSTHRQAISDTRAGFLKLAGPPSGILAPHDGPDQPWRYLHRALRDTLCAEQLIPVLRKNPEAIIAFAGTLRGRQIGRWAETFAQLCAAADAPRTLVEALLAASDELGRQVLMETDGLPPDEIITLLLATHSWSGEDLLVLARRWREEPKNLNLLRALATPGTELETVARIHYALSEVGCLGDEAAFFAAAGRPMPAVSPIHWVSIPAGAFRMGWSGGHESEGPERHVTLSAFDLGRTTVTEAEFALFDPPPAGHEATDRPICRLSWYIARLYCRWTGGRLPTEAEWEYACRAGSDSRWSFGDDPSRMGEFAWFSPDGWGQVQQPQPVGLKEPNAWGLYDMHGNVWEWCEDWFGPYPEEDETDPYGPMSSPFALRVWRGGSTWEGPDECRSSWRWPLGPPVVHVGFRVARSVARS